MAGENEKDGLKTAVDLALGGDDADAPPFQAPAQLPLSLTATEAAFQAAESAPPAAGPRGPGRPAGSRNRRTEAWVDYLLSQHRSPLVVLAETYSRPVAELARELGCTRAEAFDLQIRAARELAPYVHQKRPVAVEVDAQGVVQLVIAQAPLPVEGGGDGFRTIAGEIVENQGVEDDGGA